MSKRFYIIINKLINAISFLTHDRTILYLNECLCFSPNFLIIISTRYKFVFRSTSERKSKIVLLGLILVKYKELI